MWLTGASMLQGMQEAEKRSQAQLDALRADKRSSEEQLQAAQAKSQAIAAQVQTLHADKQAAAQEVQTMREEVQTAQQQLQADKAAAAKLLHDSRLALEKERAEWQQQKEEWEAERSAKVSRERQLQQEMAAMQAMIEEYKTAMQSGGSSAKQGSTEAGTGSMSKAQASGQLREQLDRPSTAVPLTPGNAHDASSSEDTAQPRMPTQQTPAAAALSVKSGHRKTAQKGQSPGVDACTPARTILEFGSASGTATARSLRLPLGPCIFSVPRPYLLAACHWMLHGLACQLAFAPSMSVCTCVFDEYCDTYYLQLQALLSLPFQQRQLRAHHME